MKQLWDMNKYTFTFQLFFCVDCLAALARRLGSVGLEKEVFSKRIIVRLVWQ